MKYMNLKKYYNLNLQLFAEGGDGGDGGDAGGDDQDEDEDGDDQDDPDEKKYSQKDMDDAVKKRLAREKRKWQRSQQQKKQDKPDSGDDKAGKDGEESEDVKARKAAEAKVNNLEVKVACYDAGVAKDAIEDVAALARAYMEADEDLDLEDAIEKVVKKYPSFKKGTADPYEEEEDKPSGNWGQRQKGKGTKKLSGVEAKFYELNPDLK